MISKELNSGDSNSIKHNSPIKIGSNSDQLSKRQSQLEHIPILGVKESQSIKEFDIFEQQDDKIKYPRVLAFLDDKYFQIIITVLTVYALFGDDIRVMGFNNYADIGFDVLSIICLFVFSFEICLSVIAKPGYLFSFFFWLDLISTLSLLLDIQLFNVAVGLSGAKGNPKQASQLARAGRASRIGTKAGRVVRLVRLIRIAKLYKAATAKSKPKRDSVAEILALRRKKKRVHPNSKEFNMANGSSHLTVFTGDQNQDDDDEGKQTKESRVSKALSDITTRRVIIIILLLLFVVPLFDLGYFQDDQVSMPFQTYALTFISESQFSTKAQMIQTYNNILDEHNFIGEPVVSFTTPFPFMDDFNSSIYDSLRAEDLNVGIYTLNLTNFANNHPELSSDVDDMIVHNYPLDTIGITSIKSVNQIKALISFLRTIFICVVLSFGSMMFSKDANDLALRPIERMIEKVNKIAKNPNLAIELKLAKDNAETNETVKIENAVIKIGILLALGFGDAGSEIIGSNMSKSGDVDPMLPGQKKCAIYGFCDIRNFTDATEQLQEDVMLFVNNIAEIVHAIVDRYAGAANKNIGDAFLLVWKMNPEKYTIQDDNSIIWNDRRYVEILADCAIISFMKIQAKINREPHILAYRDDKRLLQRMPNYKVKMGFGLHLGWGIEGAIGSEFKIDASYLSPNVNMASRLEAATKQYGVPLLISSALIENCSKGVLLYTRQIDKVTVKGSTQPIGFHTIDMECDNLPPSKDPNDNLFLLTKEDRITIIREKKKYIQQQIESGEFLGVEIIEENKDLFLMMKNFNPDFYENFNSGFDLYLKGDWNGAKKMFLASDRLKPEDGPTKTLMEFMSLTKFSSPSNWNGYRELTEK